MSDEFDPTLERRLRELGAAARSESGVSADETEQALRDVTSGAYVTRLRPVGEPAPAGGSSGLLRWLAIAAATVVVVAGGMWWLGRDGDHIRTSDPTVPTATTTPAIGPASVPATAAATIPTSSPGTSPATTPGSSPVSSPASSPAIEPPATAPPTTGPTGTVPSIVAPPTMDALLEGLYYEGAGIRNVCTADQGTSGEAGFVAGSCTSVVFDPSGVPVSYDPASRTVTRHLRDTGGPTSFVVPSSGSARVGLVAAGPDGVVYLSVDGANPEASDVVAFSLTAGDAGREVARFAEVLGLGDYDIVPSADGLVLVGWYGQGLQPTEPFNVVLGWVGLDGQPVTSQQPIVQMDFYEHRVVIGAREWSYTDPLDGSFPAMPLVEPTLDGGFVSVLHHATDGRTAVVRGWADGTVDTWLPAADAGEWLWLIPDPTGSVLVAHGDQFVRPELFPARDADYWGGSLQVDVEAGTASAVGLDEFLATDDPAWEHSDPIAFANAVAGRLSSPAERRAIEITDGEALLVVVTTEGYLDDSVAGTQLTFDLSLTPEGYRVESIAWSNTCAPDRGHQDYQPALCT